MNALMNSAIGIGLGGYLVFVTLNGNLGALWTELEGETGYLEFVIALYIITALASWGPTSTFTDMAIILVLVALTMRIVTQEPEVVSAASNFAKGQTDLFGFIGQVFGIGNGAA